MWGFVWQGRAYEGLTCNALEWVASHNGGSIVDARGKITIDNPQAAAAIATAAEARIDTISPEGVLNYAEEEARGGVSVRQRRVHAHWPYAWSLASRTEGCHQDRVGGALPKGRHGRTPPPRCGVATRRQLPKHPNWPPIWCSHSPVPRNRNAAPSRGAKQPPHRALSGTPVLAATPFMAPCMTPLVNAVARPSTATGIGATRSAADSGTPSTTYSPASTQALYTWRNWNVVNA